MVPKYLIVLVLAAAVNGRTASTNQNTIEEGRSSEDSVLGDFKIAYETYKDCSGSDLANCLKLKLAKALNRISKADEVTLLGGVTMIRDKSVPNDAEQNVEEALPRGLEDGALDNLLLDKIVGFLKTHTIQVKRKYVKPYLTN